MILFWHVCFESQHLTLVALHYQTISDRNMFEIRVPLTHKNKYHNFSFWYYRFLLSLYTDASCTSKQIQATVESVETLTQTSVSHLTNMLEDFVETLPSDLTTTNKWLQALREGLLMHNTVFKGLGTEHHKKKISLLKVLFYLEHARLARGLTRNPMAVR